ncbi:hypothetical protein [Mycobacterium sp. NPDC050853]|uniref:hypothetical protein n=1 Tax=Mycobacterium sp. NPDC050853 TaxID=3155160 RepID=UPI0034032F3E
MTHPESLSQSERFQRGFRADLSAAVCGAEIVTLAYPRLEYQGFPNDEFVSVMRWFVDICMTVAPGEGIYNQEPEYMNVGYL